MSLTLEFGSCLPNDKSSAGGGAHNSAQGGAQRNLGNQFNLTSQTPEGVELALAKDIARVIFHSMLLEQPDIPVEMTPSCDSFPDSEICGYHHQNESAAPLGLICVFESISQGSASLHPGLSCGRASGAWLRFPP